MPRARLLCAVSPETLAAAATDADWIHISAHGAAKPLAPAFQSLYLGDGSSDQRLYAAAIQSLDLRHVSLATLAGCETALGRVDRIDNLRGLTASLMSAGVGTVIAPVWPVRPEPAARFFTTFYRALASAGDPADTRRAFRRAQLATRAEFPAYRDWGAYVYEGRWT